MHMKEWLIAQIESGKYEGLCWEDEDKTMFRIPWKHAAKKDYKQTADAALFKVNTLRLVHILKHGGTWEFSWKLWSNSIQHRSDAGMPFGCRGVSWSTSVSLFWVNVFI